jgi:DNA polymerase-3 subunit delta'
MLDDYKEGQPIAYNIIKKEIKNNSIGHAYLFHSESKNVCSSFALAFAKTLLCPNKLLNNRNCADCSICRRIDNGNFPEINIINPDELWIKKDQLNDLQKKHQTKPLEGEKKVYIINEVDKLNVQAANSILKFLEEPESNIIAILTTDDINAVIKTITSRCQVIHLRRGPIIDNQSNNESTLTKIGKIYYNNLDELNSFVSDELSAEKIDAIVNFIKNYEIMKVDVITKVKNNFIDIFNDKKSLIWAFDIMIFLYKDVLNMKLNRNLDIFDDYVSDIKSIADINKVDQITAKLKQLLVSKEKIKYNINVNLLMDKLILKMESGEVV